MERTIPLFTNALDPDQEQLLGRAVDHFHAAQSILRIQPHGHLELPLVSRTVSPSQYFSMSGGHRGIAITGRRLSDNWFSRTSRGRAMVTMADWQTAFLTDRTGAPVAAPDANLLTSLALVTLLIIAGCDDEEVLHEETLGCLFDLCAHKPDRALKMRAGYVCSHCVSALARWGVSSIELDAINAVLERVRHLALGRHPQLKPPAHASDDDFVSSASLPSDVTLPPRLLEACRSRHLTVVVGSGMSLQSDVRVEYPPEIGWTALPTWSEIPARLSKLVQQYIGKKVVPRTTETLAELLADLDFFREKLGENAYYPRAVADIFAPHVLDAGRANRLLFKLPLSWLLTTNYDSVLQYAGPAGTPMYTWREARQAREFLENGRAVQPLLKLHGCATRSDTMVLTRVEYDRLRRNEEYLSLLRYVFESRAVFFVGFGLSDPFDLDLSMEQAQHAGAAASELFALLPRDQCPRAREKFPRLQAIEYTDHASAASIFAALVRSSR